MERSHWQYYKSGITSAKGRYFKQFSQEVRDNLNALSFPGTLSGRPKQNHPKATGQIVRNVNTVDWPIWELPSDDQQLILARRILPYIKIISPASVEEIVGSNNQNLEAWKEKFEKIGVRSDIYLWPDTPVTFPGIRRHVGSGETSVFRKGPKASMGEHALYLDDNSYPKEIWSFALRHKRFGKKNPAGYARAHILDHKDFNTRNIHELEGFQKQDSKNLFAGLYTSVVNAVYSPTIFLKPTDYNIKIRLLLIQIVNKYYGQVCQPLPHQLSFNIKDIPAAWQLENFPQPEVVGDVKNVDAFLRYRNGVIENRIVEISKMKTGNK
ncbi:MAG: hypothetical protein M3R50_04085 [Bacteroidota bacterium]|nr:hypothetical protein [Bacteroidota bacterium]